MNLKPSCTEDTIAILVMATNSDPSLGPPSSSSGDTKSKSRSNSIPSSASLDSDVQALLQESISSLDEAITRPSKPIRIVETSSTGQQLLAAVLEANRKLEREKMEMRNEIEGLKVENEKLRRELEDSRR